jgi:hypothetical protein
MALQGNLRDFSSTEILQLLGTQKKSGCLTLEWGTERAVVWVQEGRIVSTRPTGGAPADDPLLSFLVATHRLSDEQHRGLVTIQRESHRDIEDLLLNGRYLDSNELASFVERQVLDDLLRIVRWENGTYRFDPNTKWPQTPLVSLTMEGAMIEAARRLDEQKRFLSIFKDPYQLLGVRDLPDPDEPLSDEERELFGIIDGQHTVADVVELAPLSEYESYEALQRLMDAHWIEFVGRLDPGQVPAPKAAATPASRRRMPWLREALTTVAVLAAVFALRWLSAHQNLLVVPLPPRDVYADANLRDVRQALDLYARENGHYPVRLSELVQARWLASDQACFDGYSVHYVRDASGQRYDLGLERN